MWVYVSLNLSCCNPQADERTAAWQITSECGGLGNEVQVNYRPPRAWHQVLLCKFYYQINLLYGWYSV